MGKGNEEGSPGSTGAGYADRNPVGDRTVDKLEKDRSGSSSQDAF